MHPAVQRFTCSLALSGCLVACGADDPNPQCASLAAPHVLALADLSPALGSSVPNEAIVHSFSVVDSYAFKDISLSATPLHTAGSPTPDLAFTFKTTDTSVDYEAEAVTWELAPAHVDIAAPVTYQTEEGCAYQLPSPLFSYEITEL